MRKLTYGQIAALLTAAESYQRDHEPAQLSYAHTLQLAIDKLKEGLRLRSAREERRRAKRGQDNEHPSNDEPDRRSPVGAEELP